MAQTDYIGRFAPSPTGPLHLGSLTAALASWVDAKANNGVWLLRIEDIDPPREVAGASQHIIQSLNSHGLHPDDAITRQSERSSVYDSALNQLRSEHRLYACTCTRKQLRALATEAGSNVYPGFCRMRQQSEGDSALRFRVPDGQTTSFIDAVYGQIREDVSMQTGDFIVRRRGPLYAYQLAVVADDAMQAVTHVVRGADLLDNTARQITLQQVLGYAKPEYLHVPVVMHGDKKLSKQTGAEGLDNSRPVKNLIDAWRFLGQQVPQDGACRTIGDFLSFAVSHWKRNRIGNVSMNIQN